MELTSPEAQITILAFCVIALSLWSLFTLYRIGNLLTLVGGLHAHSLLIMGIGPLCYLQRDNLDESVPFNQLINSLVPAYFYFVIGYVTACLILPQLWKWPRHVLSDKIDAKYISPLTVFSFGSLAFLGYFMSMLPFASSGIGIIFPVLQNLFFPVIVLSILLFHKRKPIEIATTVFILVCTLTITLFSSWRSQLIVALFSISLGMMFRRQKNALWLVPGVIALMYILLPFQQMKKTQYAKVSQDMSAAFLNSQNIDWSQRQDLVTDFFALRTNGAREMAFVQAGLDRKHISLRDGETYGEAVLQIIPRILWPDKPSFNQTTNYTLPRQIGLLSWDDINTSWSVNLWAEAMWNFSFIYLCLFVPLIFALFRFIDLRVVGAVKHPVNRWMLKASLFFLSFQIVSIVAFTTYVCWAFILLYFVEHSNAIWSQRFRTSLRNA